MSWYYRGNLLLILYNYYLNNNDLVNLVSTGGIIFTKIEGSLSDIGSKSMKSAVLDYTDDFVPISVTITNSYCIGTFQFDDKKVVIRNTHESSKVTAQYTVYLLNKLFVE